MKKIAVLMMYSLLLATVQLTSSQAVPSTTTGTTKAPVFCYTCNTRVGEPCADTFNKKTLTPQYCEGVCVKEKITKEDNSVRRSCLPDTQIVADECSDVPGSVGTVGIRCRCKNDRCNSSIVHVTTVSVWMAVLTVWILRNTCE
ncbi:hypothetical protein MAR_021806 [Mya arenaria]|uniref:Protein quiver n=1 Tax=Mya arenaria TaxID=6604 RepID=A0ABY7EBX2_MYAAR|nr:hypothetical protein MAR_021806 [Mya arenaria]